MRRSLVIANWKMNGSKAVVDQLLTAFNANVANSAAEVVVCPPAVYMAQAQDLLSESNIALGAQDTSQYSEGAYTGEIALSMLKEFGCCYVLIGHSERRSYYGETDQIVADKFAAVIASGLTPVLCVGESEQEREAGQTETVVLRQLDAAIEATGIDAVGKAIVAYEPVWAIGTGKTATPQQAQDVHRTIRQRIESLDSEIAARLPILYGGSVKADNAAELFAMPDIDGGLVGGASLDSQAFTAICSAAG